MADFRQRDTEVLAVVVDPVERNAELAENAALEFPIAADPELRAIDAYGLRHDRGEESPIARPATFLIDAEGIVRWRDLTESYRLRPRPDDILARIDELRR